jgi:hypothetical protein
MMVLGLEPCILDEACAALDESIQSFPLSGINSLPCKEVFFILSVPPLEIALREFSAAFLKKRDIYVYHGIDCPVGPFRGESTMRNGKSHSSRRSET